MEVITCHHGLLKTALLVSRLLQELEFQFLSPKDDSLALQLCLIVLSAVDTSVEDLQASVWQPCLDLVAERLGEEVAGKSSS